MLADSLEPKAFEQARRKVTAWVRQNATAVRAFDSDRIRRYSARNAAAGWTLPFDVAGQTHELDLILPSNFPFERARVAIASENKHLVWPHVEEEGVICLPQYDFLIEDPVDNAKSAIRGAINLIEKCAGGAPAEEFEAEFVSYWAREDGMPRDGAYLTIFNPHGRARALRTAEGVQGFTVVADSKSDLEKWLNHAHGRVPNDFGTALFLPIRVPLIPPFPTKAAELIALVRERLSPDDSRILDDPYVRDRTIRIILAADVNGKRGLIGATIKCDRTPPNYRADRLSALGRHGSLLVAKVLRADPSWVHGRETNEDVELLTGKTVAILGCGSLGSHVAVRLAQSGVGAFILVDPEVLEPANVGRHVLGFTDIGKSKAQRLAQLLLERFPHLKRATPVVAQWESASDALAIFAADLIVSAIGDAGPELALNELHLERGAKPAVVYAWMEPNAAAAHALAILAPRHCLKCLLDGAGMVRTPETTWAGQTTIESEPACGGYFQPYGAVELGAAEMLAADLAIEVLRERITENAHSVYTTSEAKLREAGGAWSDEHLAVRPPDWQGALTFFRDLPSPTLCDSGLHAS